MKPIACVAILLAAVLAAEGQNHSTGWVYVGGYLPPGPPQPGVAVIGWIAPTGIVTTMVALGLSSGPGVASGVGALDMHPTNQGYLVGTETRSSTFQVGTVEVRNGDLSPGRWYAFGPVKGQALDPNGDLLVLSDSCPGLVVAGLYRLTLSSGTRSTVAAGLTGWSMCFDTTTGDAIVTGGNLLRVSPNGRVTTAAPLPWGTGVGVVQHLATGDFYTADYNRVYRMSGAGTLATLLNLADVGTLAADRASAAAPRLLAIWNYRLLGIDPRSGAVTTVTPVTGKPTTYGYVIPDRSRNVATARVAASRWSIRLSFPGDSGRPYVLGLSISGILPGLRLPDGRLLPLNVDPVTQLAITGGLAPLLTGHAGMLSGSGTAVATLDTSQLPGVSGLRVWIAAVTLDPGAPVGMRTIADPLVLIL